MKNNIKQIRERKKISYEEIAFKLGVTTQTVYNWEQGKHIPNKVTREALADLLDEKVTNIFLS